MTKTIFTKSYNFVRVALSLGGSVPQAKIEEV